jgi:hypothetical protein
MERTENGTSSTVEPNRLQAIDGQWRVLLSLNLNFSRGIYFWGSSKLSVQ